MRTALLADLAQRTAGLRDDGLFKSERVIASPQTAHITLDDGSQVLNLCANNYLGLADHPELVGAAHAALDALRLRHGVGALHLRHADGAHGPRVRPQRLPRHGRHDPLLLVLRRQRRSVRDPPRRAGLRDLRRPQPRLDHRRHPPLQGAAAALRQQRHGPAGAVPAGRLRCPLPPDRHRRRVLHGRRDRRPAHHLRPGRAVRRDGDGGRLPRGRLRRRRRSRHARVLRRDGPCRHHHRHARQGAGRRQRRLHQRPPGDRRLAAPAVAALPVQQLPGAGDHGHHAARAGDAAAGQRPAAPAAAQRDPVPRRHGGGRLHPRRRGPPDHPGDARRREGGRRDGPAAAGEGRLRDRVQLPGRTAGQGPHPHPDVGRAQRRRHRPRRRGLHRGRAPRWGCCDEGAGEGEGRARPVDGGRARAGARATARS